MIMCKPIRLDQSFSNNIPFLFNTFKCFDLDMAPRIVFYKGYIASKVF